MRKAEEETEKETNWKTKRIMWKGLRRKRNGRKEEVKLRSKELSTRGSTGKNVKENKMEKHGKRENGIMRRKTAKWKTGMVKTAMKGMTKKEDGKNMRTMKTEVSGMKKRKLNGEAVSAVHD